MILSNFSIPWRLSCTSTLHDRVFLISTYFKTTQGALSSMRRLLWRYASLSAKDCLGQHAPTHLSGVPHTLTRRGAPKPPLTGTSDDTFARSPTMMATRYVDMGGVVS